MNNDKEKSSLATPEKRDRLGGLIAECRAMAPSKGQMAAATIALLALSNVFLWTKVNAASPATEILSVGVRQLTQEYMAQLALSNLTPEEVALRTEVYLTVMQDTLKKAGEEEKVILIAREAVLGGRVPDVTEDVNKAVQRAMEATLANRGRAVPAK